MAWLTETGMWSKLFVLASVLFVSGCSVINSIGPGCDRSAANNEPIEYIEGTTENGVYMSSPWAGELLWFPGGMRYALVLQDWKQTPNNIDLWLSFAQCGTKNSTVARAAGNQAELRTVRHEVLDNTDERVVLEIVNGSCSDYWLLVVAGTGTDAPTPPGTGVDSSESDGVCVGDGG